MSNMGGANGADEDDQLPDGDNIRANGVAGTEEINVPATPMLAGFCHNCMRTQNGSPHQLNLEIVQSTSIREVRSSLRQVRCHRNADYAISHTLCTECRNFLSKKPLINEATAPTNTTTNDNDNDESDNDEFDNENEVENEIASTRKCKPSDWKNTWLSFLWNLLSGKERSNDKYFHATYSPEYLWNLYHSHCDNNGFLLYTVMKMTIVTILIISWTVHTTTYRQMDIITAT
mmetsp:Transcript_18458/g.39924  ORF Transcript_18458/g.39924 Transcript_18458/m.39924 type:complete len:232 (-) Transcript_18458:493-1188(-)